VYKVSWTPKATRTYFRITDFILARWSAKEVFDFENKVDEILNSLSTHPLAFPAGKKVKIRKVVITSQTSLAYRLTGDAIELIAFQVNRRNPKSLNTNPHQTTHKSVINRTFVLLPNT
jgi:plasmid stabilization system protein ParE